MKGRIKKGAGDRLLLMLITAIGTVLATRLFLELTGYIQVAVGQWHIAHMLWGGLLMITGMVMMVIWDWEKISSRAMVVFGVGLGWFIDEIGKFLSADNDYFFQPAVMLIYVFFVGLFLIYRWVDRNDEIESDLGREMAKRLVKKWHWGKWKATKMILAGVLVIYAVGGVWDVAILLGRYRWEGLWDLWTRSLELSTRTDFRMLYAKTISDLTTSLFFLAGWIKLAKKQRIKAIGLFETGILVNIFFGQVFKFYLEQGSAVVGLIVAGGLYYMLKWWKVEVKRTGV